MREFYSNIYTCVFVCYEIRRGKFIYFMPMPISHHCAYSKIEFMHAQSGAQANTASTSALFSRGLFVTFPKGGMSQGYAE